MNGKLNTTALPVHHDQYRLRITDIGKDGEGIGKIGQFTLFVPGALPGDLVCAEITKLKKTYGYAKLLELTEPSAHRVASECPVAGQCGGCALQEFTYAEQLKLKIKIIRDCLERIGGLDTAGKVNDILGMEAPYQYRNKARYAFGEKDGQPVIGFYSAKTHDVVDAADCCIQHPANWRILDCIKQYATEHNISVYDEKKHTGTLRGVMIRAGVHTGELMVCIIINGDRLPTADDLVRKLSGIEGMQCIVVSVNKSRSMAVPNTKTEILFGDGTIEDTIGGIRFKISAQSFFQVNPLQTERLYETALAFAALKGGETVIDAYCGIGTISLFLARYAKKVYGVEIVADAVRDAKKNAAINHITNATFMQGAAEAVIPVLYESERRRADVMVVDPPRKGCDEKLLKTMRQMRPDRIVYISCDPATLARDLKILCADAAYDLKAAQPVDMFPMTMHVETVVLLSHKKPDSHINVKVEFGEGKGKVPLDAIAERAEEYKPKERVTYKMIQEHIESKYGFKVHTAYIAEVKRDLGLPMYDAPNAVEELKQLRKHPTPVQVDAIKETLKHFKVY